MTNLLFMHLSTEIPPPPPPGQGGDLTSGQLLSFQRFIEKNQDPALWAQKNTNNLLDTHGPTKDHPPY